jgi:pyruvate dehydrogenase E2 component (dihydrolipoamide acetyltransferase)
MATLLEMPRYGATMEDGMVGSWSLAEGDAVAAGDLVCSIEIEKLTNDILSPVAGVLRKILLPAGVAAPCGSPIGIIAAADEDISNLVAGPSGQRAEPGVSRIGQAAAKGAPARAPAAQSPTATPGRRSISPKAEQLAKELGVEWRGIAGTGRHGMITREDLRAASAAGSGSRLASVAPAVPTGSPSGARRVIAQRMMESLQQTAQAAIWMDADVTELMSDYRVTKREWADKGLRLSLTALILKALSTVLRDHPVCRSRIAEDGKLQVIQKIDIAIAVDAPSGLLVPVLRDVDQKSVSQVALELTELTERARLGALSPDDMSGHTMTVSNLGMYGVTYMQPLLNLPESVLLGVGASEVRPVYREGGLFPREILPLSLAFDHRVVDGGPAAAFLRDVCRALSPSLLR